MSRRADISMEAAEATAFLRTIDVTLVVAAPDHGPPVGAWARVRGDLDRVRIELPADHPLVELLDADDRCCCAADQFPSYDQIKGVMLHGRARRLDTDDAGVATYDLRVEHVVSFDFAKIT